MNTKSYLTPKQKQVIMDHYSTKGIDYCQKTLGLPRRKIVKCANYYGQKLNKHNYINDFVPVSPRSAYTLGFITGDGHIAKGNVSIEIQIDDAIALKDSFMFTSWKTYIRQRKNWKEQMMFHIGSKDLVAWFNQNGFNNKSTTLPTIDFISNKYLHYFILGLFDADGCICLRQGKYGRFQVTSSYDYDWNPLIRILSIVTNDIKTQLSNSSPKGHRSSTINIYTHESLVKMYDYLYQTYDQDKIGLPRKHDKFKFVLEQFNC